MEMSHEPEVQVPAAITKEELLAVTAHEFDKVDRLLRGIDRETALRKDDDDTSISEPHKPTWTGTRRASRCAALTPNSSSFSRREPTRSSTPDP